MKKHPQTRLIHPKNTFFETKRTISEPWIPSTIFEHDADGYHPEKFNYNRAGNPNREYLENMLADLENGEVAYAFSSGVAAVHAILENIPRKSTLIAPTDLYHGARALMEELSKRGNFDVVYVDFRDISKIEDALSDSVSLVWCETPSNPLFHICDIAAIKKILPKNTLLAVDNTWLTPLLQQPLDLGADISVHSTTKYMGGHSDILGGALMFKSKNEFAEKVGNWQKMAGAVPSTFDCWLLTRSLKTMPIRLEKSCDNAEKIAHWLNEHPRVSKVHFPGLMKNLPKGQMQRFGAMISFEIDGDEQQALQVVANSKIIRRATSLGGVESTWEHRLSTEQWKTQTPNTLIRFSVGIEFIDDLLADLDAALNF